MKGIVMGAVVCTLAAAEPARAEACRGGSGDQHLVRIGHGPAPLFFAMAWNGPPKLERAVAVRCLGAKAEPLPRRKDRHGR